MEGAGSDNEERKNLVLGNRSIFSIVSYEGGWGGDSALCRRVYVYDQIIIQFCFSILPCRGLPNPYYLSLSLSLPHVLMRF